MALTTAPIQETRVATPQSICSVSGCNQPSNARGWYKNLRAAIAGKKVAP